MSDTFVDQARNAALRRARAAGAARVRALEPGARKAGDVETASFFAGELWTDQGECVALASYRMAGPVACRAADLLLEREPVLAEVNRELGRDTARLVLAKRCWGEARDVLVRMLAARALGGPGTRLLIRQPFALPLEALDRAVPDLEVEFYREETGWLWRGHRVARILGGAWRRRLRRRIATLSSPALGRHDAAIAVLVTHEDLLTCDRTVRSQPYWLNPEGADPSRLRVYVLPTTEPLTAADTAELRAIGVHPLTAAHIGHFERRARNATVTHRLRACERRLTPLFRRSDEVIALAAANLYGLLEQARAVAACARELGIACFVGGDPHYVQADAMAVVAELSGVPLVEYQYSNLAAFSPPMCGTADRFLLFSHTYEPVWRQHGVRPMSFAATGYPYDAAFVRVRARAQAIRSRLGAAGARTVICYFDESVQHDRYGVISAESHRREVLTLLRKVVEHADWGVVVKSQFEFNSPSRLFAGEPLLEEARRTGRYLEMRRGDRRNVVFPAEAALAADISIGHIIGATAPLESALAGQRSLMLDTHGQVRHRRDLYDRAPIVFKSMDEALAAVERWRAGDPATQALGDWTPILGELDAFRDGKAADRLRAVVEELAMTAA